MDQRRLLMHQAMLADRPRVIAYDRALEGAVRGGVVADVGAGTLALSLLALRHGAEHVYAIEADPQTAAVAAAVAERNDLKGRLTIVQGDAREVRLPRQADVVVSEMMGNLGPEEQMMEILGAFTRRNLARGGRVVPKRLLTHLVPIEFDREGWGLWSDDYFGFRLDAVQESAAPEAQLCFFQRPPRMLGAPVTLADHRPGGARPVRRTRRSMTIDRPGRLHAVAGYFTAALTDGISLTNMPSYSGCNWAVWVWPLRHTSVSVGDELRVEVRPPDDVRQVTDWRLDCALRKGK
ncbi:50S ribosomal protein L11 methyltransferase [Actinomadura sp. WMMB 499]|uniref:50S ribosomal protein L11 methyltransferase n=1 Tax=Actinomadura sp. WMMB 499 TaxID=1219491 RepID=UPI001249405D|nr:50S ribosomal protein L11 methyltransferase [Actinomadura sp. WMMB 499]QFG22956.1 methyltransferase domain-containing protein [Actinomadura sp. WMMB 499]